MAKSEVRWICKECNWSFARYMGKCPHCGAWDTLIETVVETESPSGAGAPGNSMRLAPFL